MYQASSLLLIICCAVQGLQGWALNIDSLHRHKSSVDTPLKRKSRVWTDENFACILRHCKQHEPGSHSYLNCLSENCRRGMLAVERDLDYNEYLGSSQEGDYLDKMIDNAQLQQQPNTLNQGVSELTSFLECYKRMCSYNVESPLTCILDNCVMSPDIETWLTKLYEDSADKNLPTLNAGRVYDDSAQFENINDDRSAARLASNRDLELIKKKYEEVTQCVENLCGGAESADDRLYCMIKHCQERDGFYGYMKDNPLAVGSDFPVVRKRRVNDEVSQCIQSYCGNHPEKDRLVCIVHHCHRSRSIYKRK